MVTIGNQAHVSSGLLVGLVVNLSFAQLRINALTVSSGTTVIADATMLNRWLNVTHVHVRKKRVDQRKQQQKHHQQLNPRQPPRDHQQPGDPGQHQTQIIPIVPR